MGELAKPVKRDPIVVFIPVLECEVDHCENPKQADMIVLFLKQSKVELYQVCGRHAFLWKGLAAFFPLNQSPPIQWVAQQVEQELARRRPPVYYTQTTYMSNVFGAGTGIRGGNMYFYFQ